MTKTDNDFHDDDEWPDDARCAACGVPFTQHLGVQGTCAELLEARAEIERLRAIVAPPQPPQ